MPEAYSSTLRGQFIIAMPGLLDPNFFQTVSCISEYTPQGAVGMVINRHHALLSARDIFKELKLEGHPGDEKIPVHVGGPVHTNEIFILHGPPFQWEGCLPITGQLAMSNTMDILAAIANKTGPDNFLIALGCAGWGPGQLDAEIKENAWLTGPAHTDVIFELPVAVRWEEAVRKIGIDPASLSGAAGHA
jgi:putative transcriptional regulator